MSPTPLRPERARKTTVLLADDESAITMLFEIELTRLGYHVLVAHTGTDAARLGLDETQPLDVLVTDWKMPGVTGDVLARQLLTARPALKVILMSGYDQAEQMAQTFAPTQATYLNKPFGPALLDQTIRIMLGLPLSAPATAA